MEKELSILKGIHPGLFLEHELRKRKLVKGKFALQLGEYPQLIGDITKGKRRISPRIALKLDEALGKEEGFFMILQALHDVREEKLSRSKADHPDLSQFRPAIFWDTDIRKLDWQAQKKAIITRIFERGNAKEKEAVINFYGTDTVQDITGRCPDPSKNTP